MATKRVSLDQNSSCNDHHGNNTKSPKPHLSARKAAQELPDNYCRLSFELIVVHTFSLLPHGVVVGENSSKQSLEVGITS